jgi:thioredoxin reductase
MYASSVKYDVVVIGAGPAGLTGAIVLARARRSVLVADGGTPRNGEAYGVHGFVTRDGMSPTAFLAAGRAEIKQYGAEFVSESAVSVTGTVDDFLVGFEHRPAVSARRLLVTTGLVDELPDIPGLRQRWGNDVLHCPYCHGWEMQDRAIGILGTSAMAVDQALAWRQWSHDVLFFQHTAPAPDPAVAALLIGSGIDTVTGQIARLVVEQDRLIGVEFADGTVVARDVVVVQSRLVARSALLESLGLPAKNGPYGTNIAADAQGLTAVPGVWAAGNVTNVGAQVVTAAAAGSSAAVAINNNLIIADVARKAVKSL